MTHFEWLSLGPQLITYIERHIESYLTSNSVDLFLPGNASLKTPDLRRAGVYLFRRRFLQMSTMEKTSISKIVRATAVVDSVMVRRVPTSIIANMKAMQSAKIRELRQALADAGLRTLDQQAKCLGLSRSTAWAVLKGNHKCSGLSAALIKRMLASPQLPPSAREVIFEYVAKKSAGAYGHHEKRLQIFRAELAFVCSKRTYGPRRTT